MKIEVKGYIVPNEDKDIYDFLGYPATSPKDVSSVLDKAGGMPVTVEINSYGGDVWAGSEIYSALRGYSGNVNIQIVGLAASAASVIAMAGKSEMSPTAMMMVHNAAGSADGNYHTMDSASNMLQTANKTVANAYISKTGMSEKDALSMMDQETWLTAQEALDKNLIDGILFEDHKPMALVNSLPMPPHDLIEKVRNTIKNPQAQIGQADFLQAKLNFLKLKVRK